MPRSAESSSRIGIGIVDVHEDLALDRDVAEGGDGAVGTAHAHVPHALPGLGAEAARGPSRRPATACRRTARPRRRPAAASGASVMRGAAGDVEQPLPVRAHLDADRVARLAGQLLRRHSLSRDRARPCPARRTARPRARCRCRRHGAARTAGRAAPPRGARTRRHSTPKIGLAFSTPSTRVAAVDRESLTLAHDAAARRSHRRRRRSGSRLRSARSAGPARGMEDRVRLDLLAQIGRGVDQEPALAVAAHRQRRLGAPGMRPGSPARARRQASAFEFHWGKPPPAAAPKTTALTAAAYRLVGAAERADAKPFERLIS